MFDEPGGSVQLRLSCLVLGLLSNLQMPRFVGSVPDPFELEDQTQSKFAHVNPGKSMTDAEREEVTRAEKDKERTCRATSLLGNP